MKPAIGTFIARRRQPRRADQPEHRPFATGPRPLRTAGWRRFARTCATPARVGTARSPPGSAAHRPGCGRMPRRSPTRARPRWRPRRNRPDVRAGEVTGMPDLCARSAASRPLGPCGRGVPCRDRQSSPDHRDLDVADGVLVRPHSEGGRAMAHDRCGPRARAPRPARARRRPARLADEVHAPGHAMQRPVRQPPLDRPRPTPALAADRRLSDRAGVPRPTRPPCRASHHV